MLVKCVDTVCVKYFVLNVLLEDTHIDLYEQKILFQSPPTS